MPKRSPFTRKLHTERLEHRRMLAQAGGFELIRDINTLPVPKDSTPSGYVEVGGIVYFTANDGSHGYQLWKSDGTTAGTALVKEKSQRKRRRYRRGSAAILSPTRGRTDNPATGE